MARLPLMKNFALISALLCCGTCLLLRAEPAIDNDLPQPLNLDFAEGLVSQSPFSRSVNLEETLQLTGVAYIDGRPVATIFNKATKQSVVVTDEANAQGWKLLEAATAVDPTITEVHLMVGPEVITMHYSSAQLEPKAGAGGKGSAGGGNNARLAAAGGAVNKGDRVRVSSLLGENGHDKYVSLSQEGRAKFKDLVKNYAEKKPDATPEQSSAYAQKVYAKIKAADGGAATQSNAASARPQKAPKPNKKNSGM